MSEESRRVLELAADVERMQEPIDRTKLVATVGAEVVRLSFALARQVEALEAERGDIVSCLRDVLSLANIKTGQVGPEEATEILDRARTVVTNYDALFGDEEPPK